MDTWTIKVAPAGFKAMTSALNPSGVILNQLSYEATQLGEGKFVGLVCVPVKGLDERNVYVFSDEDRKP